MLPLRRIFPPLLAGCCFLSTALLLASPKYAFAKNQYASLDPLSYGQEAHLPFTTSPPPAIGHQGMVSSVQELASQAGAEMLKKGGNAADAATAMGYSLAVVYPCAGSLGGGGFMLVHPPKGEAYFMDFRERAPQSSSPNMYLDKNGEAIENQSVVGWKSVATPGTVAGLEALHDRWGKLPRQIVMEPAIRLAQEGFVLSQNDVEILSIAAPSFRKDAPSKAIFLHQDGSLPKAGERLVQTHLAQTLKTIRDHGAAAFYQGDIAQEIDQSSRAHNGYLSASDLRAYKPRYFNILKCPYHGVMIETTPPPSAGGIALCEMLAILDGFPLDKIGLQTTMGRHLEAEAMKQAFMDRQNIGDPAFVHTHPEKCLNPHYIEDIRSHIPLHHSSDLKKSTFDDSMAEKMQTTHFSVIDKDGFAISTTQTLNGWFGGRVVAGNSGVMMNDEMDDFSLKPGALNMYGIPGSLANAIAPGKTPVSSMAPTIIEQNNRPIMVIGSPGGSRIPTTILSVVLGVINQHLTIQQAIDSSRIHDQWVPDTLEAENGALSESVQKELQNEGYHVYVRSPWGMAEGIVVKYDQNGTPTFYGGYDRRHPGGGAIGS